MSPTRSMVRWTLAAALVAVFVAAPLRADESKPAKFALLVGVKEYQNPKLPALKYTENDATELAAVLRSAGYEVVLLTSTDGKKDAKAKPTRANIDKQLKDLLAKCKKGDTLLVGLAGHGLQFDKDDNFFCPQDAVPQGDDKSRKTLLSLKYVYDKLGESPASVKLLLVDACRNNPESGRGVEGKSTAPPPPGVAVLFSCSASERAYEVDNYRHGIFFYHVIEGLRGKAKNSDDEVTWDGLEAYVRKQVSVDAPKLLDGVHQTPSLSTGELSGEPPVLIGHDIRLLARSTLAIMLGPLDRTTAERLNVPQKFQPVVVFVIPGGGGDAMGLRRNDVIRRVNGRDVDTVHLADVALADLQRGERVELEVLRDKQTLKLVGKNETAINEAEVFRRVRDLAMKDDSAAVFFLGLLYQTGQGVRLDEAEAAKWYRKAADLGHPSAQNNLGLQYRDGRGVAKDEVEAVKWFRKSADQGHSIAQTHLGIMYCDGRGVTKDEAEALKWFRKAAEQGQMSAQQDVGLFYRAGRGVTKDEAEAARWFRKAADQGFAASQLALAHSYANGSGLPKDEAEAAKWYRKAADQGLPAAQIELAHLYASGRGVAKDETEAVNWFRKAALRNPTAQNEMGLIYRDGRGVAKDDAEAAKWFRKAADQGHVFAQDNLGICYENGRGVTKDKAEAEKWYKKAADQGNKDAIEALKRLSAKP